MNNNNNNNDLEKLLDLKRSQVINFTTTEEEFSANFFAKIRKKSKFKFSYIACAAIFALAILLNILARMFFPISNKNQDSLITQNNLSNRFTLLYETLEFFDKKSSNAIYYINDELFVGERENSDEADKFIKLSLTNSVNGNNFDILLAANENDTIITENGTIVVSKCDNSTLIIDISIEINGEKINQIIPVHHYQGNQLYLGATTLS